MKFQNLSVKRLFGRVALGLVLSMSGITIALFLVTKQTAVLLTGGALLLCALVGIFVLTQAFGKRLSQFTADLCQTLDHMIAGNETPQRRSDSETQLARIGHRLARLYQIMQENRRRVDEERQELQTLVSDISHQVKTPVSNLKMATDTLLEKPMTEAERTDFIRGIRSQTDKLDFLFQALVKTSRLETGVIQLDKKPGRLFDTVAQAMSGIVYAAEKKEIAVSVDCPEDLTVSHDSKWTSEALFNLLDNAVKYTPAGGKIAVSVVLWEMYVEIKVTDTGKGISESNQDGHFRLPAVNFFEMSERCNISPRFSMKFFGRCNISRTFGFYNDLINRQKALKGVLNMSVLQTIDLKKYYGTEPNITRALDGVNFSVEDGEFVAVVGTSGSGKSTLLHMMGGLDTPTSGTVIVRGEELAKKNDEQLTIFRRRNIGFIFQNYNLVPILNVYENIVLPVELDGDTVDQKFLDEIVHLLGLEDKLKNMPNNLSGGQQQRVAIARALITKPAIVLADEPTGNLDSKTSAEVLGLIKRTSAEFRQTVVMITHNDDIARLADRIIRIEDGKIVE